jgi:membrane-associated phospholipid phosphatase
MLSAHSKNNALFCLEYELPKFKINANAAQKPLSSAGFSPKWVGVSFFLFLAVFLLTILWDRTTTEQLTNWPERERAFFAVLARVGESDWMLIPTLTLWVVTQIIGRFPLGYTLRWVVRGTGAMSGFIFLAVGLPGALSAILKVAIGRARPILMDEVGILHFTPFAGDWRFAGFPSGHATTAFAFAWALYFLFGARIAIVFVGAFLLALARIVDSAHYLSDVFVGTGLGTIGAFWVREQFGKRGLLFSAKDKGRKNRMLTPFKRLFRKRKHARSTV